MTIENSVFPLEWLRSAFPSLAVADDGNSRIYLDNPAGTQVPQRVADAICNTVLYENANLGGMFTTSQAAGRVIERGHQAMADLLGCDSDEIIIGPNMTTLTYHFSRTIGRGLKAGDEIIVTQMDHEGNVSPWLQLAEDLGLVIRKLAFDRDSWRIENEALAALLTDRTKVLALSYASNLTGSINNVKELVALARERGILTYVDAVQFTPHGLVDVRDIDCDFLACSAYKFFGPHLGVLYGRRAVLEELDPYKCRCSTNELPYRFETGTPQIELIAGLAAAVDHFAALGEKAGGTGPVRNRIGVAFKKSIAHEGILAQKLIDGLMNIRGVSVQGITNPADIAHRVPTVSIVIEDIQPASLVQRLNEENIFCWSGHNYAWEVVHQLGIDPKSGVVRIGIANYNTTSEIDKTIESVERNIAMLRQER
jgi:cysteine desulfurase family protein (TIGR01976 family)